MTPEDADLLARVLKPSLDRVRLRFVVETPGPVVAVGGRPVQDEATSATVEKGFSDLAPGKDRAVRLAWRPLALDVPPLVEQEGDRPPAPFTGMVVPR